MADAAEDIRADLEKQIAELKKEMGRIGKSLSARASDALDDAEDVYDDVKGRARDATRQMRRQAGTVSDAARDNPGTAATVAVSIGLLGLVAGLAIGGLFSRAPRRR